MTIHATDIAIVGGGMVGGALALGLAQHGLSVTVIEKHAPPAFDLPLRRRMCVFRRSARRRSACSKASTFGKRCAVMRAHAYRRLETWEWESAHVDFNAAELKLPELGYMVENSVLTAGAVAGA